MTVAVQDRQDFNSLRYLHVRTSAVQLIHLASTAFYLGLCTNVKLNFAPACKNALDLFQLHNPQSSHSPA